jgi:hypothetical protein
LGGQGVGFAVRRVMPTLGGLSATSVSCATIKEDEPRNQIIMLFLTGPTAAGKNTTAHLIAKRQHRCAVVDFDLVRSMFVQPHYPPWAGEEGVSQHRLGAKLISQVALGFHEADWKVIVLDVITNDAYLYYQKALRSVPLTIVQLLPSLEETMRRFYARGPVLTHDEFLWVYETQVQFRYATQRIDTTALSPEVVAAQLENYL